MHEVISSKSGLGYPSDIVSSLDMEVMERQLNQEMTLENKTELFARKFGLIYNLDPQKIMPAAWIRMMSFERLFNSMKTEGVNKEVEIELWKTGMLGYYTLLQQALR